MFTVLRSSAGAGKTHALVRRYVMLCLRSSDTSAYRHLLAITFTNKAASEMKERVLMYLAALAAGSDEPAVNDVRDHIVQKAEIDADTTRVRAAATRRHMLHHWSDISIHTIDAFTRRVVQPFSRDLRIDHDLRMTTEEEYYRGLAVDHLLSDAGRDENLTQLLSQVCFGLLEGERSWDPGKPLLELAAELTKERAAEPLAAYSELSLGDLIATDEQLRRSINEFKTRMQKMGADALKILNDADVTVDDLIRKKSGPWGIIQQLVHFDKEIKVNSYVLGCLDTGKWTASKDPAVQERVERVVPMLDPLIRKVVEMGGNELRTFTLRRAIQRELMPAAVLHQLGQRLQALKDQDGVAFFSDLTRKVVGIVQEEPVAFIYERLGERFSHILIDEFQDTSVMQWRALLPLAENALGNGGSLFLVGDGKQAIYRWRNGEVRQFDQLPKLFDRDALTNGAERERVLEDHYIETAPLIDNRRSGREIVEFNNAVFNSLREQLPEGWQHVYQDLSQKAYIKADGYVRMEILQGDEGSETVENEEEDAADELAAKPQVSRATALVKECLADGHAPGDIAILVQTHAQAAAMADHLQASGHAAMTSEGMRLGYDPGSQLVIDLLRFLSLGAMDAAVRCMQRMIQLGVPLAPSALHPTAGAFTPDALNTLLRDHPRINPRLPLEELVLEIMLAAGIATSGAHASVLLDEVHQFTAQHGATLAGFLSHWDRTGHKRGVPHAADRNVVQVITIHKSKGSEYPVVIVPWTARRKLPGKADMLWIDRQEAAPGLPKALVRNSKSLREIEVPEAMAEHEMSQLDELDQLYVALTRAKQRLHVLVPEKAGGVFITALREFMAAEGNALLYERGTAVPIASKGTASGTVVPLQPISAHADHRALSIRHDAPDDWDPADPDPFRAHGKLVHALLAEVAVADDLPKVIERAVKRGDLPDAEAEQLAPKLMTCIGSAALRPFYGSGIKVLTETTLIDAAGHAHRPDRVVQEDGHWRVLDIKTGGRADHHHEQVRSYVDLLGAITGGKVTGALLYIAEGELVPVT